MFVITTITVQLIVGIVMEQILVVTPTITIMDVAKNIKLQPQQLALIEPLQMHILMFVITLIGRGHVLVLAANIITIMDVVKMMLYLLIRI
jgi:hypothetical protein